MEKALLYRLLADLILLTHALFVAFVVFGQLLVVTGAALRWAWIRNFRFRLMHLLCIGYEIAQTWAGQLCPLTLWEQQLRELAGETTYAGSFIAHWLHRLLFFEAEAWVFTLIYTVFGLLVLATWFLAPPKRRSHTRGPEDSR